jgi:hypothetical protein
MARTETVRRSDEVGPNRLEVAQVGGLFRLSLAVRLLDANRCTHFERGFRNSGSQANWPRGGDRALEHCELPTRAIRT